jgi:hypothetical protein
VALIVYAGGDDSLANANSPTCNIDVTGHYLTEYNSTIAVTQHHCVVSIDPPGQEAGLVLGSKLTIAGVDAKKITTVHGEERIAFENGAYWVQQDGAEADHAGENLTNVSNVSTPAPSDRNTLWWEVGTGLAVASSLVAEGAVVAAISHAGHAKKVEQRKNSSNKMVVFMQSKEGAENAQDKIVSMYAREPHKKIHLTKPAIGLAILCSSLLVAAGGYAVGTFITTGLPSLPMGTFTPMHLTDSRTLTRSLDDDDETLSRVSDSPSDSDVEYDADGFTFFVGPGRAEVSDSE